MTLYYENDPADDLTPPQLPPLLRAVEVPFAQDVLSRRLLLLRPPMLALCFTQRTLKA